jgi:hypothetical protein
MHHNTCTITPEQLQAWIEDLRGRHYSMAAAGTNLVMNLHGTQQHYSEILQPEVRQHLTVAVRR